MSALITAAVAVASLIAPSARDIVGLAVVHVDAQRNARRRRPCPRPGSTLRPRPGTGYVFGEQIKCTDSDGWTFKVL